MSKRYEKRPVKVEKELEVEVVKCDACGIEITTSRDAYFGDVRLVVEGDDHPWFSLSERRGGDWVSTEKPFDFCSRACVIQWASRVVAPFIA